MTLRSFLRGAGIHKNSFLTILNLLADQGVIKGPETSFWDTFTPLPLLTPFPLKQDHFEPKKGLKGIQRTLLKLSPANTIKSNLNVRFTHPEIANQAELKPQMVRDFLSGANTINPENLKKILRVLLDHQIITLPEGSNVDGFVDLVCAQPASYPKTPAGAAASTTGNCMESSATSLTTQQGEILASQRGNTHA